MSSALEDFPERIRQWALELGFSDIGITRPETGGHAQRLQQWLARGLHGEMEWMKHHGDKRYTPTSLVLGTEDRKSTRLNSSHVRISYAVFCLKKKKIKKT